MKLLERQTESVNYLETKLKITPNTLWRYTQGKAKVENISSKNLSKLAIHYNETMDKIYDELLEQDYYNREEIKNNV